MTRPTELAAALDRVRAWDAGLAGTLEDTFDRLFQAADALGWARDRTRALAAAGSDRAVLEVLVAEARALTGAPEVWALAWSGDPASGRTRFRALAGGGEVARTDQGTLTPETLSRSIVGRVAADRRPAWSDDAVADARFLGSHSVQALAIRSVGCVPVGEHGVLYLCDPVVPGRFSAAARARLAALGALAGAFLGERSAAPAAEGLPGLVGDAPPMLELAATVRAFAPMPWPVLILGESGTGKEAVARAIHDLSPRARAPFVALNCATVPDELAESTLFGHEKGAFTGADKPRAGILDRVGDGTLFLDEVGELSARVQPKLLRLLQEGRYERLGGERDRAFGGRVVAATHRAIDADGGFRDDLFHRLSTCVIRVPPLRERIGDLQALADALLARALAEVPGAPALSLDRSAREALERRAWPGNVRELQNVVRAGIARAMADGSPAVSARHLGERRTLEEPAGDLAAATERFQQEQVRAALRACDGSMTAAAERLGVSRQWLHKLVARWEREP